MIIRRIILAILLTFCVTTVLFAIAPTKTATTINSTVTPSSTATSTGTYDPWVDVTHDGHINVLDLIKVATSLNTNGNPALNVTMHPATQLLILANYTMLPPGIGWGSPMLNLDGYRSFTITIWNAAGDTVYMIPWGSGGSPMTEMTIGTNIQSYYTSTQQITLPYYRIILVNSAYVTQYVSVDLYATA